MSRKAYRRHERAIRELMDFMGLTDWELKLEAQAHGEEVEADATCTVTPHRRAAILSLGPHWMGLPDEEKLRVLVHELLHCHLGPLQHWLADVAEMLGASGERLMEVTAEQHIETVVDNIAVAWAAQMPLGAFTKFINGKKG